MQPCSPAALQHDPGPTVMDVSYHTAHLAMLRYLRPRYCFPGLGTRPLRLPGRALINPLNRRDGGAFHVPELRSVCVLSEPHDVELTRGSNPPNQGVILVLLSLNTRASVRVVTGLDRSNMQRCFAAPMAFEFEFCRAHCTILGIFFQTNMVGETHSVSKLKSTRRIHSIICIQFVR